MALRAQSSAGNGNVSYELQPELQGCINVQELESVTSATCQHSADVWIATQSFALSSLATLTSTNQQCSVQQVSLASLCGQSAICAINVHDVKAANAGGAAALQIHLLVSCNMSFCITLAMLPATRLWSRHWNQASWS